MLVKNPKVMVRPRHQYALIKNLESGVLGQLNDTAYFIWKCLDYTTNHEIIANALATNSQTSVDLVSKDVKNTLELFLANNFCYKDDRPENPSTREPLQLSLNDLWPKYTGPAINKTSFVITSKCNFSCRHCYISPDVPDTMTLDDWRQVIDDLKEMGCLHVQINGGEPFIIPWIWPLLDSLENAGLAFEINTNGSLLDEDKLKKLSKYHMLTSLSISIYGFNRETFFYITNRDQNPEDILKIVSKAKKMGLQTELKYIAMQGNISDLYLLPKIEKKIRLPINHKFNLIHRCNDGQANVLEENINPKDLKKLAQQNLLQFSKTNNPLIHCGLERCSINSNGDVSICEMMSNRPLGNVHRESLPSIWLRQEKSWQPLTSSPICLKCDLQKYCARCDGISYLESLTEQGVAKEVPYLCAYAKILAQVLE